MLRYLTAGESHGKALVAILEGMPAGLRIEVDRLNNELKRRQQGLGRGKRMQLEKDKVQLLSGLKNNVTLGSPIALLIENKDFGIERLPKVVCVRPGHADLPGVLKYGFTDARCVLERASARETAARVGIGAICKIFLDEFKVEIASRVISIGGEGSPEKIREKIKEAQEGQDTLGGIFEVRIKGAPCGLGSYVHPNRRLNSRLSAEVLSIPGIKGIEIGLGFAGADKFGSQVHDAIYYSKNKGFYRKTNNAGGIEGGVSNGEEIILRACMKPISTLLKPLDSVNLVTHRPAKAHLERSDICAVESAAVVAEAVCAYVLTGAFLEKFGGDCLLDIKKAYQDYQRRIK